MSSLIPTGEILRYLKIKESNVAMADDLHPFDFDDHRETRRCMIPSCKTIVLVPRVACQDHWQLVGENAQGQIARAVMDHDDMGLSCLIDEAVNRIEAAENRRKDRRS